MKQYLEHARKILSDGYSGYKPNRTGIDSISRFGHQTEYDLLQGFPILTTKRVPFKTIVIELLWFLSGDTNIKALVDQGVHIWDDNAFEHNLLHLKETGHAPLGLTKENKYTPEWFEAKDEYVLRIAEDEGFAKYFGNLGHVYGEQWRRWKTEEGKTIDQIADVIQVIQENPMSRRIVVSAWDAGKVKDMALPPCHAIYQMNVQDRKLDIHMYQRSADMFLGVPFNITSYALLNHIIAQQTELTPRLLIHSFGDAHFYCGREERGEFYRRNLDEIKKRVATIRNPADFSELLEDINRDAPNERELELGQGSYDHVTGILEQLGREPRGLPKVEIAEKPIDELVVGDFSIEDYNPHSSIKRAMPI